MRDIVFILSNLGQCIAFMDELTIVDYFHMSIFPKTAVRLGFS